MFDTAVASLGPVGVFVNNAGTLHRAARLDEMDLARLQDVVAVNVIGAMIAARQAVLHMSTRHWQRGLDRQRVLRDVLAPNVPMQRGGSADEVAETILWLASDAASYVTGTLVNCSGGR